MRSQILDMHIYVFCFLCSVSISPLSNSANSVIFFQMKHVLGVPDNLFPHSGTRQSGKASVIGISGRYFTWEIVVSPLWLPIVITWGILKATNDWATPSGRVM